MGEKQLQEVGKPLTTVESILASLRELEETQRMLLLNISEKLDGFKPLAYESSFGQGIPLMAVESVEQNIFQYLAMIDFNNSCLLEIKNRLNEIF